VVFFVVTGGYWFGFAVAVADDSGGGNAFGEDVFHYGSCPVVAEAEVVLVAAAAVGVGTHFYFDGGVFL